MFNRLASIIGRSPRREGANGWWRESNDFIKFKRLGDGEVTNLLVGKLLSDDVDDIYQEIKELNDKKHSSFQALVASYAFAVVAFFGFSSSFEIAGLKFSVEIVPHVAIVLMNFASWSFSNVNSRLGYLTTYFEYLYFSQDSSGKAKFLLRYPQAIPPFLFARTIRGFPRHIQLDRWPFWENIALFGLLFAVFAGASVALAINIYGLWLVWFSDFPSPFLSKGLVIAMLLSGFFVWANPTYTSLKRKYRHYGLSDTIVRLPEHRKQEYHRRIAVLRINREDAKEGL
jgi:hypothetical protein